MTDYRAMCAELLAWAERTSSHYYKQADVIVRARALLAEADGPAVSGDREPASVAMQPSDNAIAAPLSPAAQAVLDAFNLVPYYPDENDERMLAAALRAVADQLQERKPRPSIGIDWSSSELYAIAAELEGL